VLGPNIRAVAYASVSTRLSRLVPLSATLPHMLTARRREMATTTAREVAYRKDGGIEVAPFWDRLTGKLTVCVTDLTSDDTFELPVAPERALDMFHHPYAYAASFGVECGARTAQALNA
jgi:hypothetical protein